MAYGSSAFGSESYSGSSNITPLGVITYFLSGYLSKANITIIFTLDAKIVSRPQKTFTLDAIVVLRNTKTFILNAPLQKSFSKTFAINAYLFKGGNLKTFTIDSRLIYRREKTFNINAAIKKTFTKTVGLAARVYFINYWYYPWKCRKLATAIGSTLTPVSNFTTQITVHYGAGTDSDKNVYCNGRVKSDFSDLRFTKQDGTTLLQYEIVSYIPSVSALVNIKLGYVPGTDGLMNFYIYYKNPAANSLSTSTPASGSILNNLLETLTVPCTNGTGVASSTSLNLGTKYIIKLSGLYSFGSTADPMYTIAGVYICYDKVPPGVTFAAGKFGGRTLSQYLDAGNDGAGNENLANSRQVDPTTGQIIVSGYQSVTHTYYFAYTGEGSVINVYLIDNKSADYYNDNSGSITAEIYDTVPPGTVTFDIQECRAAVANIMRTHRVGLRIING